MGRIAFWDVTSRCNLRCTHCFVADSYWKGRKAECSTEEGLTILDRLSSEGYDTLWILGGEPLMRKDLVDLVAGARQRGFGYVRVVSNGTRLTPHLVDALCRAGLDELTVSLDGPDEESNDELRGRGSFAKAVAGLQTLIASRGDHTLKVCAQLTLTKANLMHGEKMVRFAGDLGLDGLSIVELKLAGSAAKHTEELYPTLLEALDARETIVEASTRYPDLELMVFGRPRVIAYLNDRFGTNVPMSRPQCALENGYQYLNIKASGRVNPCSALDVDADPADGVTPGPQPGRLYEHELDQLLGHPYFNDVQQTVDQAMAEKWQDEFAPCARCQFRSDCVICPLFLQEIPDKLIRECMIALQRHSQWKKATRKKPATGTTTSNS